MEESHQSVVVDTEGHRFVSHHPEGDAFIDYRRDGDRLVIVHTEVPEELGGRGLAADLVRAAVDHAAANSLTVVPECSMARGWLERHPEVADRVTIDWPAGD